MALTIFSNLTEKDKANAIEKLIENSSPRQDFFLMIILAILMATLGVLIDNIAVVIGSMLIAPILYPIMSLSLGVVMTDGKVIVRSLLVILNSIIFAFITAALTTIIVDPFINFSSAQILNSAQPSLAYAAIAIVAGFSASFALIKPHMNESVPGIAISVALIPPIAIAGIGIARVDWSLTINALTLFSINIAGICFATIIVFALMNLSVKKKIALKAIKRDEKEIRKEIAKAANE